MRGNWTMETNKYRTSGVIDASTYREISKFSVSRGRVWFARICSVLLGLLTVFELIIQDYLYTAIFLIFTILFALLPALIARLSIRTAIKRMRETYSEGCMRIETFFTEEGIALHNLSAGGQGTLSYEAIQQLVETEHYFYLSTKANQFILVFKDLLTPEERRTFPLFLNEKCPQLKVVK